MYIFWALVCSYPLSGSEYVHFWGLYAIMPCCLEDVCLVWSSVRWYPVCDISNTDTNLIMPGIVNFCDEKRDVDRRVLGCYALPIGNGCRLEKLASRKRDYVRL